MNAWKVTSFVLAAVAATLFAGAASYIDTPQFAWNPSGLARLGLGVAGLLATGAALALGHRARSE